MSRVESGDACPSVYTLYRMCRALGITTDYAIHGRSGDKCPVSQAIRALSKDHLSVITTMIAHMLQSERKLDQIREMERYVAQPPKGRTV